MENNNELIMYQTEDGNTKIEVHMENETVWLSQDQMAELFQKSKSTINEHIINIYDEGELQKDDTLRKFGISEFSTKPTNFYSLDVIISVGYRVKSVRGTQFRIWANSILKEYLIKGFALNDEQLKAAGGGTYWKELLQKIRDIRSSERVFWKQVLDIYATSVDYDPKSPESVTFFKTVQNKLHYAAHGNTAAEIVYTRADAGKQDMGLTNFKGAHPTREEVRIAKNYLNEDELSNLNTLVSAFFDLAEMRAKQHKQMYMSDWISELDKFCGLYGQGILQTAGRISHKCASAKADEEYDKYKNIIDADQTPVEKAFLENMKLLEDKVKK